VVSLSVSAKTRIYPAKGHDPEPDRFTPFLTNLFP